MVNVDTAVFLESQQMGAAGVVCGVVWCGVLVTIEVLFFQLIGVPFSGSVT
jgi:hypothetical protein